MWGFLYSRHAFVEMLVTALLKPMSIFYGSSYQYISCLHALGVAGPTPKVDTGGVEASQVAQIKGSTGLSTRTKWGGMMHQYLQGAHCMHACMHACELRYI